MAQLTDNEDCAAGFCENRGDSQWVVNLTPIWAWMHLQRYPHNMSVIFATIASFFL
jgi:hypothetical protein